MKALVLLSGGIDSAVCLAAANAASHEPVLCLTVDYGQRCAAQELHAAGMLAQHYKAEHRSVACALDMPGNYLTDETQPVATGFPVQGTTSYVPARNSVLLGFALAFAELYGCGAVYIGANKDDAAGYPDCRATYLRAYQRVADLGTDKHPTIAAPLVGDTKVQIIGLARELRVPLELTWSCYVPGRQPCGVCESCTVRNAAIAEYQA